MPDIRAEILSKEVDSGTCGVTKTGLLRYGKFDCRIIYNAMDENAKRMCLELLEFMAKNKVDVDCDYPDGKQNFYYKGEWVTKEQLFENFL